MKNAGFILLLLAFVLLLFASCGGAGEVESGDAYPFDDDALVAYEFDATDAVNGEEAGLFIIDGSIYAEENDTQLDFVPGEITFVHRPGIADGFHYWGITETAEHGFTVEITPEQEAWIHRTEEILYMALREFGMRPSGRTAPRFFYPYGEGVQAGHILHRVSMHRLPAWLYAGIELLWLSAGDDLGVEAAAWQRAQWADGMPGFGDAWFIPGFVEVEGVPVKNPPAEVLAIAYHFVRYIYEAGALVDLVDAYRANAARGEEVRAGLWAVFTDDEETGICGGLRFERWREISVGPGTFSIKVSVPGAYARYHFGIDAGNTPQQWVWDMVRHHVAIGEESIVFVKDWLGIQSVRHFLVFNIYNDMRGGWYINGMMANFQHILDPPFAMAHEAVHAIVTAAGFRNNFPRPEFPNNSIPHFEEGLCILIEHIFEIETQNERFALEAASFRLGRYRGPGNFGDQQDRMTLHQAISQVNGAALWELDNIYEPGNQARFGTRYTVLNNNHVAASFLFYLYTERGNREDLLRFYRNIYLAEDIYGADMNGLIASWRRWLNAWVW